MPCKSYQSADQCSSYCTDLLLIASGIAVNTQNARRFKVAGADNEVKNGAGALIDGWVGFTASGTIHLMVSILFFTREIPTAQSVNFLPSHNNAIRFGLMISVAAAPLMKIRQGLREPRLETNSFPGGTTAGRRWVHSLKRFGPPAVRQQTVWRMSLPLASWDRFHPSDGFNSYNASLSGASPVTVVFFNKQNANLFKNEKASS